MLPVTLQSPFGVQRLSPTASAKRELGSHFQPRRHFCGGWGQTFLVFNFLYNNMVYTSDIEVYTYINLCRTSFLWVFHFQQVVKFPDYFQNHALRMIFSKFAQNFMIRRNVKKNSSFHFFFFDKFLKEFLF